MPRGGVRLLTWVRLRLLGALGAAVLRQPPKLAVLVLAWGALFGGLYAAAHHGLTFVADTAGIGAFLLERLWYLFLFVVMVLLFVSQVAAGLSTIIRSAETRWWWTLPVPPRAIGRAKWLESSFYSSWAVLLLLAPLACAYLRVSDRGVWLLGWMAVLTLPLIAIVTSLATVALLAGVRAGARWPLPRGSAAVGFVAACAAIFWLLGERAQEQEREVWFVALQELLPRMQIAMSPWWPSSWAATGMAAAMNGRWTQAWLYAALLWTTAGVCWRVLDHAMAALLGRALEPAGHREAAAGSASAARGIRVWGHPLLAMLRKDLALAARDPMQWSQALVFFGLLGAYFANIHRLASFSGEASWRVGLACLNLACTLLVLGSLAIRFVFPQPSLEGRVLWMLRMVPNGVTHLLRAKLWFYGTVAMVLVEGLIALSMTRLSVPAELRWWILGVAVMAAWTIVALAVGLGAWWADPAVTDAARVVSSSRGALALVAMLAYVALVIAGLFFAWAGSAAHRPAALSGAVATLALISAFLSWRLVQGGERALAERESLIAAGSV